MTASVSRDCAYSVRVSVSFVYTILSTEVSTYVGSTRTHHDLLRARSHELSKRTKA